MIIDGVYASNEKAGHTHFLRVGGTPGNDAIITPGEYIQFKFPRKVVMRDTVWNTGVSFDGGEALDSGGNPTVYGTWQWQASNAANSGYVNIGDPWHFSPGSIWIRSPMPILALRQDAAEPADYNLYLYPYWRMVLVEGPAFGSAANCNLFQVQFNLIDPDNQFPLLEVAFTDDVDGVAVTATIGPMANPYAIAFTDNTDDKMTATPTIIPNLIIDSGVYGRHIGRHHYAGIVLPHRLQPNNGDRKRKIRDGPIRQDAFMAGRHENLSEIRGREG
jgi:hypothetical protein